jgi:hypothetical protein
MVKNINWWFFKNSKTAQHCCTQQTLRPWVRIFQIRDMYSWNFVWWWRDMSGNCTFCGRFYLTLMDKCCFLSCHPSTNRNFSWFLTDRQFANWMRLHPIGLIHHVLSLPIMCMEQYLVCKMNMIDWKPLHLTRPWLAISSISCTLIRETLSLPTKRVTFECLFTSQVSSPIEST